MLNWIVILLSAIGFWIALYFTGVFYKWFSPAVAWVPAVCRLDEKSCLKVLETPRAKIFGIPNSAFGLGIYGYLMLAGNALAPQWGLFLTALALGRSVFLAYSLLFVTRIPCKLCFTTHAINLTLFVIFVYRVFHQG